MNIFTSSQDPISSPIVQAKTSSVIKHTTVLILGGGMAGVSAAHTFQAQGLQDFILLEASGRLGGRISNINFCGALFLLRHTVEEGANWIHGVGNRNNPIFRLACESNLELFHHKEERKEALSARNSEGRDVTNELIAAIKDLNNANSRTYAEALKRGFAGGEPSPDGQLNPDGPLPDCSLSAAHLALAGWKASSDVQITADWIFHDWMDAIPSCETSLLGHAYCKTYEEYGEGDAMVVDAEGYAKVVRHLAAQTFDGGESDPRLLLHETVREVRLCIDNGNHLPDSSAPSLAANERERVCVRTAEGHEYRAQYCIVTFSNAVLLSGDVRFTPSLPEWKVRAMKQCEQGTCVKVFVKFADDVRPFWDSSKCIYFVDSDVVDGGPVTSGASAPQSNGVSEVAGAAAGPSDSSDQYVRLRNASPAMRYALKHGNRYTRGYYTGWINLSIEGILPGSNILYLMLVEEMAKSLELKSDDELKAEITAVLRRMYGKEVPEPEAIHCTKWHSNPLTRVAYQCLRYGCSHSDLENLSRPVSSLHFAGDGTTVEFTGCVHGAYNTGVQQALAVLEKIRGESAPNETGSTLH